MLGSIMGTAVQGLQSEQNRFSHHAGKISRWGTAAAPDQATLNPEREMVGLMQSQRGIEANLAVVRAADDMLGTLIDVLA